MKSKTGADAGTGQRCCSKCKAERPVEEFNFRNRSTGLRLPYCRECGKKMTQSHYRRNKRQYIDRSMRAKERLREYVRQAKSRPCADCGIQYPYYVMDFDHREGEKKILEMNRVSYSSMRAIKREIEKCDVVCSNCHRERTYQRIMQRMAGRRTVEFTCGQPLESLR
jgi:hypothetical protein